MSVESEILRIQHNIANTYAAVTDKGGKVPLQPTSANLAAAVASIPVGVTQEELNQALLAKQDKLTGQPGQVVGFGADGAAVALHGWSNPNLLDNWYFADPVNQRGQTEYSGRGYTVDRWTLTNENCKLQVGQGYISLISAAPTVESVWIQQPIENPERYFDKILSFSALLQDGTFLTCSGSIPANPVSVNTGFHSNVINGVDLYAVKRSNETAVVQISALRTGIGQTNIVATKLELGAQQTLAHQDADGTWVLNDPPPNKALELAKCQRYYQVFSSEDMRPIKTVDFRPPMRVNPALSTIEIGGATYYTADANL